MKGKFLFLVACIFGLASCGVNVTGTTSVPTTTTAQPTTTETTTSVEPQPTKYTITWVVEGETVATDEVEEGVLPEYTGSTPTKTVASEDLTTIAWYEFEGWTPEVVIATEDTTYTATFTAVLTHDLAYDACVYAVTALFGESSVATFVKDEWETKGAVRFTVNVGTQMTQEAAATFLGATLLVGNMGYTAIQEIALDESTGYYVGSYIKSTTGVVAYPLTAVSSSNTIIQIQFTHYNLLG